MNRLRGDDVHIGATVIVGQKSVANLSCIKS